MPKKEATTPVTPEPLPDDSLPIVLKNFGGSALILPNAYAFRDKAVALSKTITTVSNEDALKTAVVAMRDLSTLRKGIEAARKARLAPVQELTKSINNLAGDFMQEAEAEENRIKGLVNSYQLKIAEAQREQERRLHAENLKREQEAEAAQREQQRLANEAEALRLKAESMKGKKADELIRQAEETASKAADLALELENVPEKKEIIPVAPKISGLTVRASYDFQVTDWSRCLQSNLRFWKWDAEKETLSVRRMDLKEEINKEGTACMFNRDETGKPCVPGCNIFFIAKAHTR